MSPNMEPSSPTDSGIRKRVCKACDRCRLKKSKCDGASPCSRCKSDNAICFFGERKKSHDKVYPKGYVEMLESQQAQLVAGLQELYKRLQQGQGWNGSPLKESMNGAPLTHDILERLGALKQEGSTTEHFEENLEILQQRLISNGALPMQRQASFDAGSDSDQSPLFDVHHQRAPSFVNPFTGTQFPPTPPVQSPYSSSARTASPLKSQFNFEVSQVPQYQAAYTPEFFDEMDLMTYEPASDMTLDPMAFTTAAYQGQGAINPCLTMKNWESIQEMQRHYAQPNVFA